MACFTSDNPGRAVSVWFLVSGFGIGLLIILLCCGGIGPALAVGSDLPGGAGALPVTAPAVLSSGSVPSQSVPQMLNKTEILFGKSELVKPEIITDEPEFGDGNSNSTMENYEEITISSSGLDATPVSHTFPGVTMAASSGTASVTMKNTGTVAWTNANKIKLGALDDAPAFSSTWISLPAGTTVSPGQSYTFTFPVTAPSTLGTYALDYRMNQEGVGWFGLTTSISMRVIPLTQITPRPTPDPLGVLPNLEVVGNWNYGEVSSDGKHRDAAKISLDPEFILPAYMLGDSPDLTPLALLITNEGTEQVSLRRYEPVCSWGIKWLLDYGRLDFMNYDISVYPGYLPPNTVMETAFLLDFPLMMDRYERLNFSIHKENTLIISPLYQTRIWIRNPLNSDFLEEVFPSTLNQGETYDVHLKVRNDGYNIWKKDNGGLGAYKIIPLNDDAKKFKGSMECHFSKDVVPGDYYEWTFTIRAPYDLEGTFNPMWRMQVRGDNSEYIDFGQVINKNITVSQLEPDISSITPTSAPNSGPVKVNIIGSGFKAGSTVKLTKYGSEIIATNVVVTPPHKIKCTLPVTGAEISSDWRVYVTIVSCKTYWNNNWRSKIFLPSPLYTNPS